MLVAEKGHIGMDLVGEDDDSARGAEAGQPLKGFPGPDNPGRIVRITKDKHFAARVTNAFQLLKIHFIAAARDFLEGIPNHFPAVSLRGNPEGMVYRRLDDNLVSGLCKIIDGQANSLYNTGNKGVPGAPGFPAMMHLDPVRNGGPEFLRHHGIAKEGMLQAGLEGIRNKGRGLEVHIGHPEGQEIFPAISFLEDAVLQVPGAGAVYRLVKVVRHCRACLMSWKRSSTSSRPTERRMTVCLTPMAGRSSGGKLPKMVLAG